MPLQPEQKMREEFYKLFTHYRPGDSGMGGNDPQEPVFEITDGPKEVADWWLAKLKEQREEWKKEKDAIVQDTVAMELDAYKKAMIEKAEGIRYKTYLPTEIDTTAAKAVIELCKIIGQYHLTEDLVNTASVMVKKYEEEKQSNYMRHLQNKNNAFIDEVLSILLLKS